MAKKTDSSVSQLMFPKKGNNRKKRKKKAVADPAIMFPKSPRQISKAITDSANNRTCLARIPGVCNRDDSTTVAAHINGAGMGYKAHDIHTGHACSSCHQFFDGGYSQFPDIAVDTVKLWAAECVLKTQARHIQDGLIIVKQ